MQHRHYLVMTKSKKANSIDAESREGMTFDEAQQELDAYEGVHKGDHKTHL